MNCYILVLSILKVSDDSYSVYIYIYIYDAFMVEIIIVKIYPRIIRQMIKT